MLVQWLNAAAINAIGKAGIYYGCRLGHKIPWCTSFPFGTVPHPQYVGSSLSVIGTAVVLASSATAAAGLYVITGTWIACYVVSGYLEQSYWVSLD